MRPTRALRFGVPTDAQLDAFHDRIVGSSMMDTLLWDGPESPESYRAWWHDRVAEAALGPDRAVNVAVFDAATDTMLGSGSVRPVHVDHGTWNLGYAVAPAFQGQGVGTAFVAELARIAFEVRLAERVEAEVFVGNGPSRRVLEKAGFVLEGTARWAVWKRGERRDEWRFAVIRPDWAARAIAPAS